MSLDVNQQINSSSLSQEAKDNLSLITSKLIALNLACVYLAKYQNKTPEQVYEELLKQAKQLGSS